jgi:sortase A
MGRFFKRHYKKMLLIFSVLLMAAGGYLIFLIYSPVKTVTPEQMQQLREEPIGPVNRLIIPKIGVNVEVREGGLEALHKGAWHRYPERGNPVKGGNFIVTAHRFIFAYSPSLIRQKSYLYNINKLAVGDDIIIHWDSKAYNYKIVETKQVAPNEVAIEDPTPDPRLTMYACTLKGTADGRLVVVAKQTTD